MRKIYIGWLRTFKVSASSAFLHSAWMAGVMFGGLWFVASFLLNLKMSLDIAIIALFCFYVVFLAYGLWGSRAPLYVFLDPPPLRRVVSNFAFTLFIPLTVGIAGYFGGVPRWGRVAIGGAILGFALDLVRRYEKAIVELFRWRLSRCQNNRDLRRRRF